MDPAARKRNTQYVAIAAMFLAIAALALTQDMSPVVPILFVVAAVLMLFSVYGPGRRTKR